tara:strand:+ start:832 stop:1053 length:222 start_codon:yes stop_codon:yes gene_type:complete
MSLTCPLCREEWILLSKLCPECDRIRFLMSIYSRDKILDILDKTLIVQKFKEEVIATDDSYQKPKTRSEEKKK